MTDDFIITPTEELKGLLAMMSAKQHIHKPRQIILNNDPEGYQRLYTFMEIMNVNEEIKKTILDSAENIGLSRAVNREDILIRLNMINHGKDGNPEYVEIDPEETSEPED